MFETFWNTFGTILYFIQGYFFYRVICGFLEARSNRVIKGISYVLGTLTSTVVIFPQDPVNITLTLAVFLAMLAIGFRERPLVLFSAVLMFFPMIAALNFLVFDMMGRLVILPLADGSDEINTMLSNLSILITVAFWSGFCKILGTKAAGIVKTLYNKAWILLDVVCAASFCSVLLFVYYTPAQTWKVWIGMAACVGTNIGSIWLVFYMAKSIRADMEGKNLKLQRDYYRQIEENQLMLRRFKHDVNNHFLVVSGLLEEGKTEEAKAYFSKLAGQIQTKGRIFCRDSIVNAVLNAKYEEAEADGTCCTYQIDIDELTFVDSLDICTIFANTLDNALEACRNIPDLKKRRIVARARCTENGYFSYEIQNSMAGEVREKNGKFFTTKAEKHSHGYGISNIRAAVERYRGTLDIRYDKEEFDVTIFIAARAEWTPERAV